MKPIFKPNFIQQSQLFPLDLNELIHNNHPCKLVYKIVEELNIEDILKGYKGGGTSSYDPRMLLRILFYGYYSNIFSSRKIAKSIEENIYFMWLSGGQRPDFRTINDFRGKRLKGKIEDLFKQMTLMMMDLGLVSLEKQYIDGTKLGANAHKYSFVWKKSVENYKAKLEEQIASVLTDIQSVIQLDNEHQSVPETVKVDSKQLVEEMAKLNEAIKSGKLSEPLSKDQQKSLKKLENEQIPRLSDYENKLKTLGDRNSYSKTDPDATFMRMKEDHMKNGQLKPGYNVQISTENQIITHYSIHPNPTDTLTLKQHLTSFKSTYGKQSSHIIADAGYGSEENYQMLENELIEFYIPYNTFRKEQKKKFLQNPFHPQNLFYNPDLDFLVCPMGQRMEKKYIKHTKTSNGFEQQNTVYQAQNCQECPLRSMCHKSKGNRKIEINHNLKRLKNIAKNALLSQEGKQIYQKRCIEPEPVFGNIKHNKGRSRFTLRSKPKVNIEFGLIAMAHNLAKWVAWLIPKKLSSVLTIDYCIYTHLYSLYRQIKMKFSQLFLINTQKIRLNTIYY